MSVMGIDKGKSPLTKSINADAIKIAVSDNAGW